MAQLKLRLDSNLCSRIIYSERKPCSHNLLEFFGYVSYKQLCKDFKVKVCSRVE